MKDTLAKKNHRAARAAAVTLGLAAIVAVALLAGCGNPLDGAAADTAAGSLVVTVASTIDDASSAAPSGRSIHPTAAGAARYTLLITRDGYDRIVRNSATSPVTVSGLAVGTWTVIVRAYDAQGLLLGESSPIAAEVTTGGSTPVSATIEVGASGAGRLTVRYSWPAGQVDVAEVVLTTMTDRFAADPYATMVIPDGAWTTDLAAGTGTFSMALAASDPENPYVIVLKLAKTVSESPVSYPPVEQAAHIVGGLVSSDTIAISSLTGTPAAPSGLTATMPSAGTARLTWTDNAVLEEGFRIYRSDSDSPVQTVSALTETADVSFSSDITSYSMTAYNRYGESDPVTLEIVPLTGFTINDTSVTIDGTGEHQLDITYTPADATFKDLSWDIHAGTSDTTTVNYVTVTPTGLVRGNRPGTAAIRARSISNSALDESPYVTVTVPAGSVDITINVENPAEPTYGVSGVEATLDKTADPADTMTVTATSGFDSYRWFVDDVEIDGATTNSVTVSAADVSPGLHYISLEVTYEGRPEPYRINETFEVTNFTADVANLGLATGVVRQLDSTNGLADVTVSTTVGGISYTATTGSNGEFRLVGLPAGSVDLTFSKTDYLPLTYRGVTIAGREETRVEGLMQILTTAGADSTGTVSGVVTDAFTGRALQGAVVKLRSGVNTRTGAYVQTGDPAADATATTNASGAWSIAGLSTGYYTAEIAKNGYIAGYLTVVAVGNTTRANQNTSVSEALEVGEVRIVMTWNNTEDFDLHLDVPKGDGVERLFYSNTTVSSGGTTLATLDEDDADGYGPETITVPALAASGTYTCYVHSYYEWDTGDGYDPADLAVSGVKVRVFRGTAAGSEEWAQFNVPNQTGDLWSVFTMTADSIAPVNTIAASGYKLITYTNAPAAATEDMLPTGTSITLQSYSGLGYAAPNAALAFAGWTTDGAVPVVEVGDGGVFSTGTEDVTLTPVFTAADAGKLVIKYAAGYEGATNAPVYQVVSDNTSPQLEACTFSRPGYRFNGWATEPGGTSVGTAGDTYTVGTADMTLYALWVQREWSQVGGAIAISSIFNSPTLALDGQRRPVVLDQARDGTYYNRVRVWDDSAWSEVGTNLRDFRVSEDNNLNMYGRSTIVAGENGVLYVAYRTYGGTGAGYPAAIEYDPDADSWSQMGAVPIDNTSCNDVTLVLHPDGTPYLTASTGTTMQLRKYNGTAWETVGAAHAFTYNLYSQALAFAPDGTLYAAAWQTWGSDPKIHLLRYDTGTSAWVELGVYQPTGGSGTGEDLSMAVDSSGVPYIGYSMNYTSYKVPWMLRYANGTFTELGGAATTNYTGNPKTPALVLDGGTPYLAYGYGLAEDWIRSFDGTEWVDVWATQRVDLSAGSVQKYPSGLAADGGALYWLLITSDGGKVFKYE